MPTSRAWIAVWIGLGLAALGCEQNAEDKAMQAAQQGQMVSLGPGGAEGKALEKVAPFPKASAYVSRLRAPEVEPAAAAAMAALTGPLRGRLAGRRVGVIVCGSNISAESFHRLVAAETPGD